MPQGWQGALPFRYHVGGQGGVKVHLVSDQDYQRRTIWDVIGKIKGAEYPDEWVVAGNHRDAWVYGAVDPNSGTAAMLEAVHGIGALLKEGWRPKRTMVFCSWDAEEEGLIGSTEWVEQHAKDLERAVLYFNADVAVAGPDFSASAVPSLKQFLRDVTKSVPSPAGPVGLRRVEKCPARGQRTPPLQCALGRRCAGGRSGVGIGFHALPAARRRALHGHRLDRALRRLSLGLRQLRLVHPQCRSALHLFAGDGPRVRSGGAAHGRHRRAALRLRDLRQGDLQPTWTRRARKPASTSWARSISPPAEKAATRLGNAGQRIRGIQMAPPANPVKLNAALRNAEAALITQAGLPNRPWFKHTIYAPGEYTGYAAVVIPGVNEAIEAKDANRARQQLEVLADALNRAAQALSKPVKKQKLLPHWRLFLSPRWETTEANEPTFLPQLIDPVATKLTLRRENPTRAGGVFTYYRMSSVS